MPFDPTDISGCTVWLDASQLALSDGDPVTTWDNLGTAADFTSTSGQSYQTNEQNSLPIVRFDGVDDFLTGPSLASLTAGTVFLVVKLDNDPCSAQETTGLWYLGTGSHTHYAWTGDNNIYDTFGSDTRKTTVDPSPSLATWNIYSALSKSGEWTSWLDESQLFTTASNTVAFPSAPRLGAASATYHLDGDVAEFVLYGSDIGSTDRARVWNYLGYKWDLGFGTAPEEEPVAVIPDIVSAPALR